MGAPFTLGLLGIEPWETLFGFDPDDDSGDDPGCGAVIAVLVLIFAIVGLIFLVVAVTS